MPPREPMEERLASLAAELSSVAAMQRRQASPQDYVYDKAQEQYWDIVDGTLHGDQAVDASIPIELWRVEVTEGDAVDGDAPPDGPQRGRGRPRRRRERLVPPSQDIRRVETDQFVEGSTWWPGESRIIRDKLITANGIQPTVGRRAFNTYNAPPAVASGAKPENAAFWVEHVMKLWPDPAEHTYFLDYCAHMVQHPEQKCNAAIVLSGTQGIGKDAALDPIKAAVGEWNSKNIDPDELFSPYRPWLQSVMLVVDEVRPTKDEFHASAMYNTLKPLIAAPPNTLPMNDKYAKLRHVVNVLRVFMTTNDWLAMYIPEEDRRMFIMHSQLPREWYKAEQPNYFDEFFAALDAGGRQAVAAWLHARDVRSFNPKQQVAKTAGWEAVATSWSAPDDGVHEALEALGRPEVFFSRELLNDAFDHKEELAAMIKSPRKIAHRLQKEGYSIVKCPSGDRWDFQSKGTKRLQLRMAFAKQAIFKDQAAAVAAIMERGKELMSNPVSLVGLKGGKA